MLKVKFLVLIGDAYLPVEIIRSNRISNHYSINWKQTGISNEFSDKDIETECWSRLIP